MSARLGSAALLAIVLVPAVSAQSTSLVSTSSGGVQGNGDSTLSPNGRTITSDGRFLVFTSAASNLVAGDAIGWPDVFVRDTSNGQVERISTTTSAVEANNACFDGVISDDGRFVAFVSAASNLASGDFNFVGDVFVRDRQTGLTTIVSAASNGEIGNGESSRPVISSDGMRIAFQSAASNLVQGDNNGLVDIFVRNQLNNTVRLMSAPMGGGASNGDSFAPAISGDGQWIAFESLATNLVPGDLQAFREIFVRQFATSLIEPISVTNAGLEADQDSLQASLSFDGNLVAFASSAANLGVSSGTHVFLRDRANGVTRLIDKNAANTGHGNGDAGRPVLSKNGAYLTFTSKATDLVANDPGPTTDAYVTKLATLERQRASVTTSPTPADPSAAIDTVGGASDDGRFVVFASKATNLVAVDPGALSDIFVRDVQRPWYRDADADGFGDVNNFAIDSFPPAGFIADSNDCDDSSASVHPGAPEICNGVDDDCDQQIDETVWSSYCTSGISQNGCQPHMTASGIPSASASSGFFLEVTGVDGQRSGAVIYGLGSIQVAWAFGSTSTRCVAFPWARVATATTGGTAGQCNGQYSIDWLAFMATHPGALGQPIAPGDAFYTQGWYRDPGAPKNNNLTDAVSFTVCP